MSEVVRTALALPYNPDIELNMVLANGGMDQSLSLAQNVPFLIGELTLYLQVHILWSLAYDILLGQPFDILMQSVVHNFRNESQMITKVDPNIIKKVMVPTTPHSSYWFTEKH